MGQSIHKSIKTLSRNNNRILMAGQTGCGKSSIINHLKLGEYYKDVLQVTYPHEQIEYNNLSMNVWSLNGQWKSIYYLQNYFDSNDAIIYVLDSLTSESINQARYTINKILSQNSSKRTPVLIFANNKNQQMNQDEIKQMLKVDKLVGLGQLHVQECCAIKGDGVVQGFEWLSQILAQNNKQ